MLDPFAGGSVRGIVAAWLGRSYVGIDLREEQLAANETQWQRLAGEKRDTYPVKVSAAMARLPFHGCEPEYIRTTCHAACCESSSAPGGILITIHPSEQGRIEARGAVVREGLLQPRGGERRCPFKTEADLCGLHETPDKPFGCIASPFTLNDNGTLIVRNRYKLLRCYDDGPRLPAYRAFEASLKLLFGAAEAGRIAAHLDAGGGDLIAAMPAAAYAMLGDNDAIKHGRMVGEKPAPQWQAGDSRNLDRMVEGEFDFLFSCPPYADLERYSDDPRDLSTLDYQAFLAAYREIIAAGVDRLHRNRFACFVVGDVRDEHGFYRNFVSDTIAAFQDAGARLYNEAILVTALGSLPIRVGRQFEVGRKLGKTHQNCLVFFKGDPDRIRDWAGACEFGELAEEPASTEDSMGV